MPIAIKRVDGVSIMRLVDGADAEACIDAWKAANPGQYVSHREIAESDIPPDRSRRHAWADLGVSIAEDVSFAALKASLKDRAIAARHAAIYTNITIPFPVDEKEIQFRNDQDRQNLSDKVTGAIALAIGGQGGTSMNYVCADNSVATMTASEFITAGLAVLAAKDAIFYQYKGVKDMIDAAEDAEDLVAAEAALDELLE